MTIVNAFINQLITAKKDMIIFWFHPVLAEIMNKSLVDGDQDTSSHQASNATTVETRTLGNLHLRLVGNRIKQRYKLCL